MRQDENGMIVVEFMVSFMLFIFLVISILSLVNIFTLQARINFAATQAAETVSMYCYVLEVTGAAERLRNIDKNAQVVESEANELKQDLNGVAEVFELDIKDLFDESTDFSVKDTASHAWAVYERASKWITSTAENPKQALSLLVNYGIGEASHFAFGEVMRLLTGRYLSNGSMDGDEYLKSFGVVDGLSGLTFYDFSLFDFDDLSKNDSVILTEDGDIRIVIRYKVDYTFGALPLPFKDLEVTHVVKTKAWLNGNEKGLEELGMGWVIDD